MNIKDAVITVDAMHTQHDTAKAIIEAGGDYVFTVKKNQPKLHAA
ncbi:MAG: ISAs1 family transposase, partial [Actinobacteria bacterium]|nr:ISAs1 family transposase [Actinomycetota bacterium]